MTTQRRRAFLASLAGSTVALSGCSSDSNGEPTEGEPSEGETVVERTVTATDGNPLSFTFDATAGSTLQTEVETDQPTLVSIFDSETGQSLATIGEAVVAENVGQTESEPVPDTGQPMVAVARHPDARVDVTITQQDGSGDTTAISPGSIIDDVSANIDETASEQTLTVVAPLWVHLIDEQLSASGQTAPAFDELQSDLYGALANQEASAWAAGSVETIAEALAGVTATAVSAKTGIPAFLVEDLLNEAIQSALEGERVTWSFDEATPHQFDATGGNLEIITTLEFDLTIGDDGHGVGIRAPMQLLSYVDAETVPATANIDEFNFLTDRIVVE